MEKIIAFLKKNVNYIIIEILFTILLLLMLDWIVNERDTFTKESGEPVYNGNYTAIEDNGSFVQYVTCEDEQLAGVKLYVGKQNGSDEVEILVEVYNSQDELLAQAEQSIEAIEGNRYITFFFGKPVEGVAGEKLKIVFSNETGKQMNLPVLLCNSEGVLCNAENNNLGTILLYRYLNEEIYKLILIIAGILIWLVVSIIIFMAFYKGWETEYIFAILYLTLGLGYMFSIPLSAVPDEAAHFLRAYDITEGHLVTAIDESGAVGDMLPSSLIYNWTGPSVKLPDTLETRNAGIDCEKMLLTFPNTALYSPFTYTPQVIGILFGKLVSNSVYVIAYCGRFAVWLAIGIILFLSIRYIPYGKNILVAIALLPMNMHECISLAADGLTFAVVVAFISYVLYMRYRKEGVMSRWELLLLYILIFYVATCKIVYVPVCLFAFCIPIEKFGSRRKYIFNVFGGACLLLVTCLGWLMISSQFLIEFNAGVNSSEQVRYILHNLIEYIRIVFNTTLKNGEEYFKFLFAYKLGWANVICNMGIVALSVINLVYISVKERVMQVDKKYIMIRSILMFICLCIFALIYTSLYVQWTPVAKEIIDGIQGRYFIPVLLPFILVLKKNIENKNNIEENNNMLMCVPYLVIVLVNISVLGTLLTHYII